MRLLKNRQSGFIKHCSSLNTAQSPYEPHYEVKDNESFSKFDDEFSSFCYKYPHEESQNQFSLFVFNQKQKPTETSKTNNKNTDLNQIEQNNYKLGNQLKNKSIQQDEKILKNDQTQPEGNMRQTHVKFNKKKHDPITRITTNYYSATTTYKKINKLGADNNNIKNPSYSYNDQRTEVNDLRQNYMGHQSANSPRVYQHKQVGKLRKTSKEYFTERSPVQINKKYHQDMYENGQEYYRARERQAERTEFNLVKRIKSDENLLSFKNIQTQQYTPRSFAKKASKQQFKVNDKKSPYYLQNKKLYNTNLSHQYPNQAIRRNYKQVSESSVVESEPSFLKERLQEVERRKLQLLQKKQQLQEMKKNSRQIMEEHGFHTHQSVQPLNNQHQFNPKTANNTFKSRKTQNQKQQSQKVQEVYSLNSSCDGQSLSQSSEQTLSQKDQSESISQSLSDSQNQTSQNQRFCSRHVSQYEFDNQYIKYQHQYNYNQPLSPFSHIPKSPQNKNSSQNMNCAKINAHNENRTHLKQKKTTPLKIIKQIQKRSEQLKKQELKEMYEKEGISVAKGGVSFDINTKDFIYPQKETDLQNPNNSPSENTQHKQNTISKESVKNNPKKNQLKINSKQELKRRRELAKSYDRYSRNRIFGAS